MSHLPLKVELMGFEDRPALADALARRIVAETTSRFCPLCGADILGNDPHGPQCPKGDNSDGR